MACYTLPDGIKPLHEPNLTNHQWWLTAPVKAVSLELLKMSVFDISLKITNLTHWGRVTHICVSKIIIIGSDNGLLPGRRQAIIWTNAGILLIGPMETNFNEILIAIHTFSFKKMHLKMSSGKRWPFCLGLNVLWWQAYLWAHLCGTMSQRVNIMYIWSILEQFITASRDHFVYAPSQWEATLHKCMHQLNSGSWHLLLNLNWCLRVIQCVVSMILSTHWSVGLGLHRTHN